MPVTPLLLFDSHRTALLGSRSIVFRGLSLRKGNAARRAVRHVAVWRQILDLREFLRCPHFPIFRFPAYSLIVTLAASGSMPIPTRFFFCGQLRLLGLPPRCLQDGPKPCVVGGEGSRLL